MNISTALNIRSGRQLAAALADSSIHLVLLANDVQLSNEDWAGWATPVQRQTNLKISGRPAAPQTEWPVLDLNFVKGKVSYVFVSLSTTA
jgi:hypothetical protein